MSTITYLTSLVQQAIGRLNNYEANAKKVDELPHQTTLEPTSKLPVSRAGVSEHITVQQIISSIQNSNYNQLLAVGTITVVATDIIVESGVSGQINSVIYGTSTDTTIPITLCATGFNRKDILVLTTSNTVIAISGEETDGAIVLAPPVPIDTVYITEFDVSDSAIGTPIDPILGTQFKKKTESLGYGDPSLSGTNAVIQLRPEGNSYYALGNVGLVSIDGFGLDLITGVSTAEAPYSMKDLFIENTGTTPFTLKHDGPGTADVKFFFTDETDLIVPAKGILWLKYGNTYCQLFFKSWSTERIIIKDFLVATTSTGNWRFRNFESGTSYTPTVLNSGTTNFETALTGSGTASIPYQTHSSFIAPFDMKLVSITVAKTDIWDGETFQLGFGTHLKTDASNVVTDGNSILEVTLTKGSYTALKKKYTEANFGSVIIPSGHSMLVGWIGLGRGVNVVFELEKI
jgi:hypothetical protein